MDGERGAGFTWPPVEAREPSRPAAPDLITLDDLLGPRRARGPVRSALDEVERVWLGFGSRAVGERLRAAGWAPPPACWRCGGLVGPHEVDGEGCAACRAVRVPWDRFVRLGTYDGVLRDAVLELKLTAWRRIGAELGAMMGRRLAIELERAGQDPGAAVITPVPTTHRRRLARGVDHTWVLARAAAAASGARTARLLTRAHRPRQSGLSATDRLTNVRNTFGVCGRPPEGAGVVVVLDDVRTTGATLRAACLALARGGAVPAGGIWACVAAVGEVRRGAAAAGQESSGDVGQDRACPD